MREGIRHTKTQANVYHKQIKDLVLTPLQNEIIKKLARSAALASTWQHVIFSSFTDYDYQHSVDSGSQTIATQQVDGLSAWHEKKIKSQFERLFSVNILPILNDKKIQTDLNPIITTNINLIKSISPELLDQVQYDFNAIISIDGFNQKKIMDVLTRRFSVANSRAKLIASDQTGKTIGALTGIRQKQVGVKKFIWRTSEDEKVRPEHAALDGKIFTWDNPPIIGIPGQPIRCRCVAIPYIRGVTKYF